MRTAVAFASLLLCQAAVAQHFHHAPAVASEPQFRRSPCNKRYAPPRLDSALQKVSWKVTGNDTARKYFSQGITLYYGFNFEDAARSFRAALDADPTMAMAAWGVALASGMNINIGMQGDCSLQALQYAETAVELARAQPGITKLERDLIAALRVRYQRVGDNGVAADSVAYAVAMRRVWETAQDDANVASLYAESMLDLRPWGLFDVAQRRTLDTEEIINVVKAGLKAEPNSVGANHLLIHAVEAGPQPSEALHAANILDHLVPASGHLVHMPSHIYILRGEYSVSAEHNTRALQVDLDQYTGVCSGEFETYWANPDCPAVYFGHYVGHNHFFRAVSEAFAGRSGEALASARRAREHAQRFVVNEPGLQHYMTAALMMEVAHQRWTDALKEPEPPAECYRKPFAEETGCHLLRAMWNYARGMAFASLGDLPAAKEQASSMGREVSLIVPPTPTGWGNNSAAAVLSIPTEILAARIAWQDGKKDEAVEHLKLAVTHEDALSYDEPPQWFAPSRDALGGAYLQTRRFALARDTFRAELKKHARSGRALYGLLRALEELHDPEAAKRKKEFREAWKDADYEMNDQRLW